jgi:uncharacterized membrane protein
MLEATSRHLDCTPRDHAEVCTAKETTMSSEAMHEPGSEAQGRSRVRRRKAARRGAGSAQGNGGSHGLARALGWFSVGLGLAELAAPRRLARLIGLAERPEERLLLLRALGVRELASGAGILAGRRPTGWLWSRVAGDAMDLGLLGRGLRLPDADARRVTMATAAVAGVTALDVFCAERARREPRAVAPVRKFVTINRSPEDVYAFWRDLQNLPRFMANLESIDVADARWSHWRVRGPGQKTIEWDAEIVDDQPNRRIAWQSTRDATVPNRGAVEFAPAPGGRGTEIRVELAYEPPAGAVGAAVATLFGKEPGQQVATNLRRLKQILETGDVPTAAGPSARRGRSLLGAEETR